MRSIIDWLLGTSSKASGHTAANRMKLMVIHDRAQLPNELMAQMKAELLEVIKKYFEVDPGEAEFLIETHEQMASIVTSAPLRAKFVGDSNDKNNKGKNKQNLSASAS